MTFYLVIQKTDLSITINRQEVINITIPRIYVSDIVYNWHLCKEQSRSDHKYTIFDIVGIKHESIEYTYLLRTDTKND